MVGQWPLKPFIYVRIVAPEQKSRKKSRPLSISQRAIVQDREAYFEAIFTTGLGRPKPVPV